MNNSEIEDELYDLSIITQEHDDKIDKMMFVINQSCLRIEGMISLLTKKYKDFDVNLEVAVLELLEERKHEYAQWRKTCDSEGIKAANNEDVH